MSHYNDGRDEQMESREPGPASSNEEASQAEPMSATLMGRLFVVPAVIVTLMICVAIVVVLFGGTAVGQRQTIDELISAIEAGSGKHTAGVMLLPRDREVWQAAQELSVRLERKDKELTPEEIDAAARRIARILETSAVSKDEEKETQPRQVFLLLALARLGTGTASETVAAYLDDPDAMMRQFAIRGLMEMSDDPAARGRVERVVALLDDPAHEVRMVACAALGVLADQGDERVIRALREKLDEDREIQWNAALALGRLGSPTARFVLLNMLDRSYWERNRVQYQHDSRQVDRPFTPVEVANYLQATIDVAGELDDADLRAAIETLMDDPIIQVREAARRALK
jgi:HEAT repeat protein